MYDAADITQRAIEKSIFSNNLGSSNDFIVNNSKFINDLIFRPHTDCNRPCKEGKYNG